MRRFGSENRTRSRADCGLLRCVSLRAIVLGLAGSATVRAGDEGPDLSPPIDLPAAAPTLNTPHRPIVSTPSVRGPVLALPGITIPPARSQTEITAPASSIETSLPALDAPIEMRNAPPAARSMQPPMMESIPLDRGTVIETPSRSTQPGTRRTPTQAPAVSSSTKPVAPPPRRPWFFGGPRSAATPVATSSAKPAINASDVGETRSDPTTETALKRKIERQARAAIGDRARAIEVRVVGKQVAIEARGVRFIQKRGVRKALENLPALSGLRSSVAVLD